MRINYFFINDIASIIDCEHKTAEFVETSNYLSIGTADIKSGRLIYTQAKCVDEATFKEWTQRGIPQEGDIFFTREAPAGESCLIPKGVNVCMGQRLVTIKPDRTQIVPEYLSQLLNSELGRKEIRKLSIGTTVSRINIADIKKIRFPKIDLNQQMMISQILFTWDKSIEATERLLENSKKRKKALMEQLLTGKKRLPGFDREWLKTSLFCIAKIEMGSSPSSDAYNDQGFGLPLVQGNADIKDRKSSPRVFTSEVTKEAYPGDILMSVRAPVGEVSISDHHCCIGRGVCSIKADESRVNQGFLFQLLLSLEPSWASISQGSTFESVNSKDVKNLQLSLPPLLEQTAIAEVLATADAEIDLIARRVKSLKSEKTALMQQILTGKRRVKLEAASA